MAEAITILTTCCLSGGIVNPMISAGADCFYMLNTFN